MGPRRETSTERDVRKFILRLFKKENSYREIAKIVGRSHSCVQKIIGRFKSDGLIENKSGRGSKSILSDVAKRKVLKDIKIDPKPSAVKLAAETSRIIGRSVSAETVRNVIRHAGYSSRVARKKPFIILQNQKKHLEFAKTHQLKTDNFWKKVIFSDEIKHGGGSVMVWGCMASNGVGNLVFIDGIMDHKLYIDILNNNLKESAKKLGLDGNFIFLHELTGCKRRNSSSRSEGLQRKKNKGPERQLNKRGLPSSSNSNYPLNKKLRQSEASPPQRETGPYHLRPRNKVTKEAGYRSSRGEMRALGGPVRSRGGGCKRPNSYNQCGHYRQQSKQQGRQKQEQEPRNGGSSRQSPRQSQNSRQQDRQETNGTPEIRRTASLEVFIVDVKRIEERISQVVLFHYFFTDRQARRFFARSKSGFVKVIIVQNDEAHFWLNGYVNKQNCRHLSETNPQVYVETPLHPEKLTVWCALWAGGSLLQKR
ncbi:transposable element Tcb2 transposase [Trichonephila clavipes]|nr:transposable element Tcb2 transposase [Trichonephila clavipes]